jgi:hypothetical protein
MASFAQNECSSAIARSNCFSTAGLHEVGKFTLPSCSGGLRTGELISPSCANALCAMQSAAPIAAKRVVAFFMVLSGCSGFW